MHSQKKRPCVRLMGSRSDRTEGKGNLRTSELSAEAAEVYSLEWTERRNCQKNENRGGGHLGDASPSKGKGRHVIRWTETNLKGIPKEGDPEKADQEL